MSFWGELTRRNVVKVAVAYGIVAWLLIQIADTLLPVFGAPDWVLPVFVFLLAAGFIVSLILSWAYELTPDGIKPTSEVPPTQSITKVTSRKLNYVVIGLLVMAVVFLVVDNYVLPERAPAATAKSIVVLPFENLSTDPDQDRFADGLSAELLNSLDQIEELRVTPLASAAALRDTEMTIPEIADLLDVEYLIRGNVNRSESNLRISVQILSRDGTQLRSIPYDRRPGDVLEIQQSIAREVASMLEVELGFDIERGPIGGTEDPVAQELYLSAGGRGMVGVVGQDILGNLELIDRALERDPAFALAWIRKAELHRQLALFPGLYSNSPPSEQWALADQAVQRAIVAAPELAAALNTAAINAYYQADWQAAEAIYRQAAALGAADDVLFRFTVGHIPDNDPLGAQGDPLNSTLSSFRIAMLDAAGATDEAMAEYERGRNVFSNWAEGHYQATFIALPSPEWTNEARVLLTRLFAVWVAWDGGPADLPDDDDAWLAAFADRSNFGLDDCATGTNCILAAAIASRAGDLDLAIDLLREGVLAQPAQVHLVWRPALRALRQTEGFKQLMRDVGLADYWKAFGWPTLCEPVGDDDFRCR